MASAEIAATAIGRNSGTSRVSAASATKNPLSVMDAKKSGPSPPPPPRPPPAATAIVIRMGTADSTAMPAQLRRRPKISSNSEPRKRGLTRRRSGSTAISPADIETLAGQRNEQLLQVRPGHGELAHPDPVVHQRRHHLLRGHVAQRRFGFARTGEHVAQA